MDTVSLSDSTRAGTPLTYLPIMGDMADYCAEQWEGNWEYEADSANFAGGTQTAPSAVTCRACQQTGLHWGLRNNKWRLFGDQGIHLCRAKPLPVSEL